MSLCKRALKVAVDYNFLYLLSALFVLIGCLRLMHSPSMDQGCVFGKTVLLLTVLQAYELLLLLVGYSVYKRMGMDHDGLMLAVLSLLLLFDPTFFNNRLYTSADGVLGGLVANVVVFALASFKLYVMVGRTRIPFTDRFAATLVGSAGFVFLAPALFHACPAPQRPFLLFLLCAAVPLVPLGLTRPRRDDEGCCPDRPWSTLHYRFEKYAFFMPVFLLPLHLYELGLIYDQQFLPAVTPWALLASGVAFMKLGGETGRAAWPHVLLAWAAAGAAIVSCGACMPAGELAHVVSPLRLILMAGAGYLVLSWAHSDDLDCLWHASAFSVLIAAGGTFDAILANLLAFHPAWIFILLLNLFARSVLRGELFDHLVTGLTGALFVCRVVPMSPAMSLFVFLQVAACYLLLASRLWNHEWPSHGFAVATSLAMVGLSALYAIEGVGHQPTVTVVLHLQIVTALGLWLARGASWAAPAGVAGCLRFHVYPLGAGSGGTLSALMRAWAGHLSFAAAFGLLLLGYYVSVNKERLLADLDTSVSSE